MILLDTDVCIEILRGNKNILSKRAQYDNPIAISFLSVAELYYGAYNSPKVDHNLSIVEEFLLTIDIVESDMSIMKCFGKIKAELKSQNNLIADADILISATTLEKCDFLVTGNTSHFKRIEQLKIENWIR